MREVTFIGSNGSELVLEASDGEKLSLKIDEQLRSAVRLAPSQKASGTITPREIQDAVRAGATIAQIVASSGAEEDFVTKFATPVLEELEHMVSLALSVRVEVGTDRFNEMQFAEFGDLISERVRVGNGKNLAWSAHRETPSTWQIRAVYEIDGSSGEAVWIFDPRKFTLSPENSSAIALGNSHTPADRFIPESVSLHPAAGSAVRDENPADEATLLDAFRARRDAAAAAAAEAEIETETANEIVAETESEPNTEPEPVVDSEATTTKKGRAPMPSWDEIVFGAKSDD